MPLTTIAITGVLQDSSGGAQKQDGSWVLVIFLGPWKRLGEPQLAKRPIRIEVPIDKSKLDREIMRLEEGLTVKVTLTRLTEDRQWDDGTGITPIKVVKPDAALKAAVEALRAVVVKDADLGPLELDRRQRTFEGHVRLGAHDCDLTIEQSGTKEDRARDRRDIARARAVVAAVDRKVGAILKAVVREYVPIYNKGWRQEGPTLTAAAFAKQLTPQSLTIHDDGSATVWIDSGNVFEDHIVKVSLDAKGTIAGTKLA